jgi:ribosomal protein L37AE/L43A
MKKYVCPNCEGDMIFSRGGDFIYCSICLQRIKAEEYNRVIEWKKKLKAARERRLYCPICAGMMEHENETYRCELCGVETTHKTHNSINFVIKR